jgi:hypothetical protein
MFSQTHLVTLFVAVAWLLDGDEDLMAWKLIPKSTFRLQNFFLFFCFDILLFFSSSVLAGKKRFRILRGAEMMNFIQISDIGWINLQKNLALILTTEDNFIFLKISQKVVDTSRVTRLGEFSPVGRLYTLYIFLKNYFFFTTFLGLPFPTVKVMHSFWQKMDRATSRVGFHKLILSP